MSVIITLWFAKFSKPCILTIVFTIYFETIDAPYHTPDHTLPQLSIHTTIFFHNFSDFLQQFYNGATILSAYYLQLKFHLKCCIKYTLELQQNENEQILRPLYSPTRCTDMTEPYSGSTHCISRSLTSQYSFDTLLHTEFCVKS